MEHWPSPGDGVVPGGVAPSGSAGGRYPAVRPTEASLPVTPGGDVMPYLGAGLLLVLAGASLMLWLRLRRARRSYDR